ncbi:MAG: ABC transporter substrate-binding protein [Bacteroidetes bacterium]|jgi:ABC-type nitrate/sulfonate/bicarbonate transport system substrate-binding protein|nr:ABC transporter substrate-binding protein [Bacteroidota bacterium]
MEHTALTIALDWTPNTNHTGFFVAQALGYYNDLGLNVRIVDPSIDNYETTPAKKLDLGEVDFAIAPTESAISLNTKANKAEAVAIAALLQEDVSAIAVLDNSGIDRPADLDGRTYASYGARYEDKIVQRMIQNDGGKGELHIDYPEKLGIWNTLLENKADATWIFQNWEGVEAETQGIQLRYFKMSDYDIPYGYSPVLLAMQDRIRAREAAYRAFLQATKRGFLYAQQDPEDAVRLLAPFVPDRDREQINLLRAQLYTNEHYGDKENWGKMAPERVQAFTDWLRQQKIEEDLEDVSAVFSNDLLQG